MTFLQNLSDNISSPIKECVDYIRNNPMNTMPLGKYPVNKNGIYLILQEYVTEKPENRVWEAHRKYVDLQVIISGEEVSGIANLSQMTEGIYDSENDFLVCHGESAEKIDLYKETGIIFMPEDVHMPCLIKKKPTLVRKAVFKIPVDCFDN